MTPWRELIDARFGELRPAMADKRATLADAVRRHVRPGMSINPCSLQSRPCAAVFEVCRQFHGTRPEFEFISSSMGGTYLSLIHFGLLKKMIVSFAGEGYPTPGPSPIVARALDAGEVELENMTMLTIPQRLMAGALGVPFTTTRSLAGSSIGAEVPHAFREIDDPFAPGGKAGVLRAYRPDVSFVHVWAADPAGNALCHPPYSENIYGALAAREGVILTAEHIVDTDFIRRHAALGRIPAGVVKAVCHVPFGGHPTGSFSSGVPEFESYGNDYDFIKEHRRAQKTRESYDAWAREWILDAPTQEDYLRKLGAERITKLRFVAKPESWRAELEERAAILADPRPANAIETMIVMGGRAFARRAREGGFKTALSGIGHATLMTWLAEETLRREGIELQLMAEIGVLGHDPRPADPFVFNFRNLSTATMLSDIFEALGLHTGGADNDCLGAIGAAQIDRLGNVNSTRMGGRHIVGSGGANDIASAARETVVIAQQRPGQFVEIVEYVTSPGARVRMIVTTMGVYEKPGDAPDAELELTGWFEGDGEIGFPDEASALAAIKAAVGWDLKISDRLERHAAPTADEITMLRAYDPEGLFLGKETAAPAKAAR